jgi:hypothetical protein
VRLAWELGPEYRGEGFYIARSKDGDQFKTIGFHKDNNNPGISKFEFTDINPYLVGYYRLRWSSGEKRYTSQAISAIALKTGELLLMPNPATTSIQIVLKDMDVSETDVYVYDLSGRLMFHERLRSGKRELNISRLLPGMFAVRAVQNGKVYIRRFQKR